MVIPEKLKLNKFRAVRIPKKSEFFKMNGLINAQLNYSGEELVEHTSRKMEAMNQVDNYTKDLEEQYRKNKEGE